MDVAVIVISPILVLLGYSWFQLYTSRWEQEDRGVDRLRVLLFAAVTLDIPCVFLPFLIPGWKIIGGNGIHEKVAVILSGTVPLLAGGLAVLRKGPARIAMPVACLFLVAYASFIYWFIFVSQDVLPM